MKEGKPLYKIGDKVLTVTNMTGTISHFYFNEASKEWVYCFHTSRGIGCVKESNIISKL